MSYDNLAAGVHYIAGENAGVYPRFFIEAVPDTERTEKDGCPRFKDVEYVEVIRSGETKTKPVFQVEEEHRIKWAEQYQKFKKNQDTRMDGMPIEQWSYLRPHQIRMLRSLDVFVVEQIADWPDGSLESLGESANKLRQHAREAVGRKEDVFAELRAENKAQAEALENLQAQVEALKRPPQTEQPRRGRPPKA